MLIVPLIGLAHGDAFDGGNVTMEYTKDAKNKVLELSCFIVVVEHFLSCGLPLAL